MAYVQNKLRGNIYNIAYTEGSDTKVQYFTAIIATSEKEALQIVKETLHARGIDEYTIQYVEKA